jgi:hypothetical protein
MAMKLWIAKNTLYKKTISFLRLKYKKFYRLTITWDIYQTIKYREDFIASVQLARFINTIRSAQRNYLRIPDDGRLPNTKDRIEQQYIYASIIYEILQSLPDLSAPLKNLQAWKNNPIRKELNRQKDDKDSYYNKVLEPLRNKVVFHFDKRAVSEAVDRILMKEKIDLATSDTKINRDMIFNLVDDLVLNYIVSRDDREMEDIEKYDALFKYVLDISDKVVQLATECILEIWKEYIQPERSRLEAS